MLSVCVLRNQAGENMKHKMKKDVSNEVEHEGWNAEILVEEGASIESDDIIRQMLRGDESVGNPDDRDIVGSSQSIQTEDEREENNNSNAEEN
jgi:hypothetical protein